MTNSFETDGMFSWFELITNDVENAKKFYGEVMGWEFMTDTNNPDYTLVMTNGIKNPIAGILNRKAAMVENPQNIPPHWGNYITIKDINSAVSKAKNLGGKVMIPCTKIPKVGIFSVIQDPQGAIVALMEYHLEV